jgi:hypothetical protein
MMIKDSPILDWGFLDLGGQVRSDWGRDEMGIHSKIMKSS